MPSPGTASLGDPEQQNREHADEAAEEVKALDKSSQSPAREPQVAEESKAPDAGKDAAEEEKKEGP